MTISDKGIELIEMFESFRAEPYLDAVGVPTIGFGTTRYSNGERVRMDDKPISRDEAADIMRKQINDTYGAAVNKYATAPTTQDQFDALTSFTYNLGTGSLRKSTLLKYHNEKNYGMAANEFKKWVKAGGVTLKGLVNRRNAERELYES